MSAIFKRILIPVDFSINTDLAVQRAIELNGEQGAAIHFFHLERSPSGQNAELALEKLKASILEKWPMLSITVHVGTGTSVPVGIIGMARLLHPDLIIIGKHGNGLHFPFFSIITPRYLAQKTNTPVLTAKPGSMNTGIKTIVILIERLVSERELEITVMISKRTHSSVHLATTLKGLSSTIFVKTHDRLRQRLHQEIPSFVIEKKHIIQGALNYAESVKADLVVINPSIKDSIFPLGLYLDASSRVRPDSKLQILECS